MRLDIHGCVQVVLEHFERDATPDRKYHLNRQLQYRLCVAWSRCERSGVPLSERECIMLAEAWLISAADFTNPISPEPS